MVSRNKVGLVVLLGLFIAGSLAPAAMAQLATLTAAGTADGFTLTTFATTNPGATFCCPGPFGVAVASNGNIIVSDGANATRYVFPDVDGQTIGTALFSAPSNSSVAAYATAGGNAYGTDTFGGNFVQFNNNGTINHNLTFPTQTPIFGGLGMWGDPINGHIISNSNVGLVDINPLDNGGLGSYRLITGAGGGDGLSVSPDGSTVYSEQGGAINGYSIATGTQTFFGSFLPSNAVDLANGFGAPDGAGVITSTNSLNGDIIVNFNGTAAHDGGIGLLDPVTGILTAIATGGTRGDYVSPDTTNGTLFLDYSDLVARLSCGQGCSIGGPPPQVAEPASIYLLGSGLVALAGFKRRKLLNQA